jgi:hypothetical protein
MEQGQCCGSSHYECSETKPSMSAQPRTVSGRSTQVPSCQCLKVCTKRDRPPWPGRLRCGWGPPGLAALGWVRVSAQQAKVCVEASSELASCVISFLLGHRSLGSGSGWRYGAAALWPWGYVTVAVKPGSCWQCSLGTLMKELELASPCEF